MCDRGGHGAAGSRAASRGGDARDFQYPTEHWGEPGRAGPLFLPQTPSRPPARPARPPVRPSVSRGPAERNFARSRPGRRPAACAHARSASLLLLLLPHPLPPGPRKSAAAESGGGATGGKRVWLGLPGAGTILEREGGGREGKVVLRDPGLRRPAGRPGEAVPGF